MQSYLRGVDDRRGLIATARCVKYGYQVAEPGIDSTQDFFESLIRLSDMQGRTQFVFDAGKGSVDWLDLRVRYDPDPGGLAVVATYRRDGKAEVLGIDGNGNELFRRPLAGSAVRVDPFASLGEPNLIAVGTKIAAVDQTGSSWDLVDLDQPVDALWTEPGTTKEPTVVVATRSGPGPSGGSRTEGIRQRRFRTLDQGPDIGRTAYRFGHDLSRAPCWAWRRSDRSGSLSRWTETELARAELPAGDQSDLSPYDLNDDGHPEWIRRASLESEQGWVSCLTSEGRTLAAPDRRDGPTLSRPSTSMATRSGSSSSLRTGRSSS